MCMGSAQYVRPGCVNGRMDHIRCGVEHSARTWLLLDDLSITIFPENKTQTAYLNLARMADNESRYERISARSTSERDNTHSTSKRSDGCTSEKWRPWFASACTNITKDVIAHEWVNPEAIRLDRILWNEMSWLEKMIEWKAYSDSDMASNALCKSVIAWKDVLTVFDAQWGRENPTKDAEGLGEAKFEELAFL